MERVIKISFTALAVFALVFGFVHIVQSLKLTFNDGSPAEANASEDALNQAKLKTMDTDGDGLSDWDEIHIYHTSPYLKDTDSDGIDDGTEVKNGTDPNCPTGRVCGSGDVNSLNVNNLPIDEPAIASSSDVSIRQGLQQELQKNSTSSLASEGAPTPAQIRALLFEGGVSLQELKGASDQDLIKLFQETVNQLQNDNQKP